VPDWEVDCCWSSTNPILCAASYSWFKLFKERNNASVLNFSASDFTVDATDSACVNTDTSPLCDVFTNSHIAAKDAIEGVININENTRCILTEWCSHSCHNRCRDVDLVLWDCIVILPYVVQSCFLGILGKDGCCNQEIHELWSFVYSSRTSILHQILINNLS